MSYVNHHGFTTFGEMLSKVMVSVEGEIKGDKLVFLSECGKKFSFFHEYDCCENVDIENICGDLQDLVGSPIILAEEVTSEGAPDPDIKDCTYTWTFYKFSTIKGSVTVRWLGSSNGCYSEKAAFKVE